jgi:DNA-directed RNA polymerase specialized sigma24 family protein
MHSQQGMWVGVSTGANGALRELHMQAPEREWLMSVLTRCCPDAALRDDLVQEALLRMARATSAPQAADQRPWMRSVVLNCWRDHMRRRRLEPPMDATDERLALVEGREAIPGYQPEEQQWLFEGQRVPQSVALRAVHRALGVMGPDDRRALLGHYGLASAEADYVGETASRRKHAWRARTRLVAVLRTTLAFELEQEERGL